MDRGGGSKGSCYYSALGVRRDASYSDIRTAYRSGGIRIAGEAKRHFQQIQEAYSVLSDQGKRSLYDAGFYDPTEEEGQGFCDFTQDLLSGHRKRRG